MPCNECQDNIETPDTGCLCTSITSCIVYDGEDVDCADIASGQTLNQVLEQLGTNDCDLQEQIDDLDESLQELSGIVVELSGNLIDVANSIDNFSCEDLSGCSLNALGDVDVNHVSGEVLISNGTKWINYPLPTTEPYVFTCTELSGCTLNALGNVIVPDAVSGDVVIFNGTNWINYPIDSILENLREVITTQQDQIDYILSHLYDCCTGDDIPTPNTDFAAATVSMFCVEGIQNRLSYTFNANPVAGITSITVKEIAVIIPSATPSIVTKNHPLSLVLTTQMREILDATVLPENKFRIKIQYTQSATTKTAYLFFNIPYLDYNGNNEDHCIVDLPMTLSGFQDLTLTI